MSTTSSSISASGGCVETIAPRSTILSLRNAGSLVPGCSYTANDITWVSAGGISDFTAVATAADALSSTGYYESPTLNPGEPWEGEMDWDNGRIYYLKDAVTRENTVYGDSEVQSFPWSTAAVTRTTVRHSVFNYSGGTVDNVVIDGSADVRVSNGSIRDSVFQSGGRLLLTANSSLQDVSVESDGYLTISGGGSVLTGIRVASKSFLSIGAATRLDASSFTDRVTGYMEGGTHVSLVTTNYAYLDCRGWKGEFTRVSIDAADVRITGTGRFVNSNLMGLGYIRMNNVTDINITHLTFNGYGWVSAADSRNLRISYVSFDGLGYLYCDRTSNTNIERCNIDQNGQLNANDSSNFSATRCKVSQSSSLLAQTSTGNIDFTTVSESSTLNADQSTGLRVTQLIVQSGSQLDIRTTSNLEVRETLITSDANVYFNGSRNCRLQFGTITSTPTYLRNCSNCQLDYPAFHGGFIYFDGSQNVSIVYLSTSIYGYARGDNLPNGSINRVSLEGGGSLRMQGAIGASWAVSEVTISSGSDLRLESNGRVQRSNLLAGAVLTTRHNGTIDKAFVMQITSTQTVASTNLRLHSVGPF